MISVLLSDDAAWLILAVAAFVFIILPVWLICYAVGRHHRHAEPFSRASDFGDQ